MYILNDTLHEASFPAPNGLLSTHFGIQNNHKGTQRVQKMKITHSNLHLDNGITQTILKAAS